MKKQSKIKKVVVSVRYSLDEFNTLVAMSRRCREYHKWHGKKVPNVSGYVRLKSLEG